MSQYDSKDSFIAIVVVQLLERGKESEIKDREHIDGMSSVFISLSFPLSSSF